uniref:Uncharacterized protein n=1 Tax=Grammatophora oceanica TaxID=210454 RepID=A0A7S1YDK2_9STRA
MTLFWKKDELFALMNSDGNRLGGDQTTARRQQRIEEQRRLAAEKAEERAAKRAKKDPPNWRENEEKEVWTAKQEKQFAKALVSFGGVPPKARYTLIEARVDGKNRTECLMHHKLLLAKEKEANENGVKQD